MQLKVLFMQTKQDYKNDLAEIRSMMERSSRFLSLSGLAGILAGLYALSGVAIAYFVLNFKPVTIFGNAGLFHEQEATGIIVLGSGVLLASIISALILSLRKAARKSEPVWNANSKRFLANVLVPLLAGGGLILICIWGGLFGLLIPLSLIFYGLALWNAGNFSFSEIRFLGIILILLGLLSAVFLSFSLWFWGFGFGLMHVMYGSMIYIKHER